MIDHREHDNDEETIHPVHEYWLYITDYDTVTVKGEFRVAESRAESFFDMPETAPNKYLKVSVCKLNV